MQPLPPRDVLLVFATGDEHGSVRRLRISVSPDVPRFHLQHGRVRRHEGPPGRFFRALAEALVGRRLARLAPVRGDRILRLELRAPGEPPRALLAELVGRHGNLVLAEGPDRVVAVLVPPPADKEDPRLEPGKSWEAPPGRAAGPGGPSLAEVVPEPASDPPTKGVQAPLSWRVESALGQAADELSAERSRKRLSDRVARRLKRARTTRAGLDKKRASAEGAERALWDGELLKAHLGQIRRGQTEIVVPDFYLEDQPERRIALDPKLDPHANLERLFARHKKLLRAQATVEDEIERADRRVARLEELAAAAADLALGRAELEALAERAAEEGLLERAQVADPRRRPAPAARLPYRTFVGGAGSEIRVGRSARDNDALTFRHARGNDLWLHTADAPGSHVVLRLEKNAEPDPEEVLDAAHLAVHFSPLSAAGRARVHVCRQKEVRKPRGAKPGLVHLKGGRTRDVRMQPERLRRLLGPRKPD